MNLTNETIESTYGNLLTIGDAAGTPTQGTLQNGNGQAVTNLTLDELQVNKLVQTQATIAASGTSLASATLLTAGVNLVTSADSNNISVKLPQPELGLVINVVNTSSRAITVYPYSATDSILGLNDGEGYSIPEDGQLYRIVCVQNPNVGVWSVSTPTANNFVTKTVTINMVADGTYGTTDTSMSTAQQYNAQNSGPFGVSPNKIYLLQTPAANVDWIDTSEFDTYNQHRITGITLKSNIPAGDLTANVSQLSSTLMGITSAQFGSLAQKLTRGITSLTPANGSSIATSDGPLGQFLDTYSFAYANGNSLNGVSHYLRGTALCQQVIIPTPNADWIDSKMNGSRRYYYAPRIQYGSGTSSASGFPNGFSFECELILTFEFK
jgi:hypothetical protein